MFITEYHTLPPTPLSVASLATWPPPNSQGGWKCSQSVLNILTVNMPLPCNFHTPLHHMAVPYLMQFLIVGHYGNFPFLHIKSNIVV